MRGTLVLAVFAAGTLGDKTLGFPKTSYGVSMLIPHTRRTVKVGDDNATIVERSLEPLMKLLVRTRKLVLAHLTVTSTIVKGTPCRVTRSTCEQCARKLKIVIVLT